MTAWIALGGFLALMVLLNMMILAADRRRQRARERPATLESGRRR